jgi:Rrf2 family iron-responsive transcriptional regulator
MRLTQQTSYSLQTLMYCAINRTGPSRIRDIAKAYKISELHLFKIMHVLVENNLIETLRGRNGGIRLARNAESISLGEVVRAAEGSLALNDCMSEPGHVCAVGANCGLGGALNSALKAFFDVLDGYTIADMVTDSAPITVSAPAGKARTAIPALGRRSPSPA